MPQMDHQYTNTNASYSSHTTADTNRKGKNDPRGRIFGLDIPQDTVDLIKAQVLRFDRAHKRVRHFHAVTLRMGKAQNPAARV